MSTNKSMQNRGREKERGREAARGGRGKKGDSKRREKVGIGSERKESSAASVCRSRLHLCNRSQVNRKNTTVREEQEQGAS